MNIVHDQQRQRFSLFVEGAESYLTYMVSAQGQWNFNFSFTPPALRGQGLARRLVLHARDYCREQGITYVASCPYVAHTLDRNA
jgi:predicted GNAT family acetyltransferase